TRPTMKSGSGNQQEPTMKMRVQLVIEGENGKSEKVEEIVLLERGALRPEELGLTLAEAKAGYVALMKARRVS
ncbi:hypothetical protein DFQ30_005148, partial [Apophysomyces sp. BC1015]